MCQADRGKYSGSTFNERKQMSTKTSIKRIALVAVSALGFGLLSVVPAKAATQTFTVTLDTAGSTTTPVAGSPVVVSLTMTGTGTVTAQAGAVITTTATITSQPTNSGLVAGTSIVGAVTTNAIPAATGTMAASANTLVYTQVSNSANPAAVMGTFTFTPVTAGYYRFAITPAVTTASTSATDDEAVAAAISVGINVRGASLVQAASGLGTSLGTQVVDRPSAAVFCVPAASTTASRYTVTATGANITGAFAGASQADAVNATSYTSGTGITQNTPNSYATGFTYAGAATATGVVLHGSAITDCFIVQFTSATAGAATVTARTQNLTTGVLTSIGSVTVEYGAVAVVSPSLSTVYIGTGNARPTSVETTAIRIPSTAGVALSSTATSGATIAVNVFDTAGNALVNQAITATITGAGLITLASGTGTGSTGTVRTASLTATTMAASSQAVIGVSADGTRGTGTITITAGGVTIATKTVTFYGAVATLTATQGVSIMRSGRTASSTASDYTLGGTDATLAAASATGRTTATNISIVAKDVDGNVVPLAAAPTAVISDSTVISDVTITDCAGGGALTVCAAGAGNYIASTTSAIGGVSGAKATVTFRTPHPTVTGTYITTAALPFSLGGTQLGGTVTMTLDKATYAPGERVVITFTAKDSAGNPVRDWTTTGTPSSNKAMSGLAGGIYVNGKEIVGDEAGEYVYAPTVSGPFTVTLATGTATGAEITAKATVSDDAATAAANAASDAAAEAIDAANAATDAANLAAEAADAATVAAEEARDAADAATAAVEKLASDVATLMASLKAQITTLANTVAKIAKKVKA